jgi:hypothetical protein
MAVGGPKALIDHHTHPCRAGIPQSSCCSHDSLRAANLRRAEGPAGSCYHSGRTRERGPRGERAQRAWRGHIGDSHASRGVMYGCQLCAEGGACLCRGCV